MSDAEHINQTEIDTFYERLYRETEAVGYHLNPDVEFSKDLIRGLLINEKRYGYLACPCRLASGRKNVDIDIICPCDYRDADISEYGACYCALYVSEAAREDKQRIRPIPERRPSQSQRHDSKKKQVLESKTVASKPIWRCMVCGYLCGRDEPPERCPICKAKKDRFEFFL